MKNRYQPTLIAAVIAGVAVQVDANSIPKDQRTQYHGEFDGTKVNSPEACQLGESTVIWPEAGKRRAFSMPTADFGLLATKFLEANGKTVTAAA